MRGYSQIYVPHKLAKIRGRMDSLVLGSFTPIAFQHTVKDYVAEIEFMKDMSGLGLLLPKRLANGLYLYSVRIKSTQPKSECIVTLVHEAVHIHYGLFAEFLSKRENDEVEGLVEKIAIGSVETYPREFENMYDELTQDHVTSPNFPLVRIIREPVR